MSDTEESCPFVISFSGLNGCGKSTFIEMFRRSLILLGKKVEVFHCPDYQSETGEQIKRFLDGASDIP